jgi:thioesterase domain-containing protein
MKHNIFGSLSDVGHSHLVPFRTAGDGSPLFCLPGAGGDVQVFREMVAALPEGQPVYAIDLEWLCDVEEQFTVEQLAAFYIEKIKNIQSNGPYYFCGYSFGGLVAYEMAMRLIEEGNGAKLVALLDVPNPALIASLSESDSAEFRKTYLADRIKKYGVQLVRGEIKAFTGRAVAFVVSRLGRLFMPAIKVAFRMAKRPLPLKFRASDPGFLKAWHSYSPRRYAESLVCFRVEDRGPEHDRDLSMGWDACVTGGVRVHVVPGDHVDMMQGATVLIIAETLATYLDRGSSDKHSVSTS